MAVDRLEGEDLGRALAATARAVVCFQARWCGLCVLFAPRFQRLSEELPHVRFFRCDPERRPAAAGSLAIDSLPFVALYEAGRYVTGITTTKEAAVRRLVEETFGPAAAER